MKVVYLSFISIYTANKKVKQNTFKVILTYSKLRFLIKFNSKKWHQI